MKKNYHPDYEILASIFEEHIHGDKEKRRPFQKPANEHEEREESSNTLIWIILGILIVALVTWFYFSQTTSKTVDSSPSAAVLDKIDHPSEELKRDLAKEIDLIKGVLDDLVQSVETLSQKSQPVLEKEIEIKKFDQVFPIKVVTQFANLRQNPKKDAASLSTVQKDTLLVAIGEAGEWIMTFAPSGKEAWVHSSVILKMEK